MVEKRKLVFIMHDRPAYPGGPIINYRRLLPTLADRGHDVHLICFYKTDYPNAAHISTSKVRIYPYIWSDTKTSIKHILKVLKEVQPDVFIPDVSTPGCFAGKWLSKCGIPVITTLRGNDKNNWGRALYFADPSSKYSVSGIVCVSQYLKEALIKKLQATHMNATVIPSGVPVREYTANQSINPLRIVYAGRLVNQTKNIFRIVTAFINLCSSFQHVECNVIGDGPELDACKTMVTEAGMDKRIRFTPFLTDPEYSHQLAQNHIIVLFSDHEGTPGALMDGMACGLIPVVLRYPGVEGLITHQQNGWIIENTDTDLVDAINILLGSVELRIRLSEAARETIFSSYSLENAVVQWEKFIEICIQKVKPKRTFYIPKAILLPRYNNMLVEDFRPKRKGLFSLFLRTFDRFVIE